MSNLLKSNEARAIAEGIWGTGGTKAYRVTLPGAFHYSCAGHGGLVISADSLDSWQRKTIESFGIRLDTAKRVEKASGKRALWHTYRKTAVSVPCSAKVTNIDYYLFEEDCAWCLAVLFCGITSAGFVGNVEAIAKRTFQNWYNPFSTRVIGRKIDSRMRGEKSADLITSALSHGDFTKFTTANGEAYLTRNYREAQKAAAKNNKFGLFLLSEYAGEYQRAENTDLYSKA